jgi:bla regulator protein blaR1
MIWQHLRSENIAQALCLTLAHSLWQGIVLAVLAAMIILLTKNSSPLTRYAWLLASLGLFTLSFSLTLLIELNDQNSGGLPNPGASPGTPTAISRMLNNCLSYSQDHAPTIVNGWLLIIAIRSLWLLFGLSSLERMKRIRVKSPGPDWEALIPGLAKTMGIRRVVTLLESGIVKIPLTIGYLKPIILIPAGLLTGLGQQEIEMILLHELAHVLRKDYLINILQRLLETLFFFNPVVIWLSARIRAEREHCVDDLVIHHTKDQTGYIKALVYYEQYRAASPTYALAFGGKGTLARLKRLISHRSQALHKWELFGLALLLSIGTLLAGLSPVRRHTLTKQETVFSPVPSPATNQAFEAKRKAEAQAFARRQSSQNP